METVCFCVIAHTEIFPELILHRLCLLFNINLGENDHYSFSSQRDFNDMS
ncbi:hypothetical protein ING2E5A_0209 [Petrimonas mucosa]|jgi:hypothetical protein|uniref:Uncharacterized protein n=1 Tax=Petrimonas mucosa TaxID=1642646 RepID=A0A1G4G3E0_9BACT|nr:hypothetical protein ING2E5A_0209 [Petrimonas mucosa]